MSHIQKYLLALVIMILPCHAFGQQQRAAEPYLEAVSNQFRMDEGYEIQMDYIREDLMRETSAEGEGMVWIKGIKYKILIDEFIVYFDGTKQYSQNTETEEVYVSIPDPDEPSFFYAVPISIIKSYKQNFKYQLMGKKLFHGKECMEVELYPMDLTGPYALMKLYIRHNTKKLVGVQLRHKEGILYTMVLSEITSGQKYSDEVFVFDPDQYPNTDIIELMDE